jgi:hypothetical protein
MVISSNIADAKSCPHPAIPLYSQVTLSDEQNLNPGSTATYKCDDGYELFGPSIRICSNEGKWSGELPYCGKIYLLRIIRSSDSNYFYYY